MPEPGQTFAGIEIIAKLGQGGMGSVYQARQPLLKRMVALKIMTPELNQNPDFVRRFTREAAAAANLSHPNMVQVYTAGESDGIHFIAMEFVEGESLKERMNRLGHIEPREAIAITVYVAQALQYAWNKARLIHRDIKPDNIFLSNTGEVKVGDLGLAKSLGAGNTELTQTGMAMGSPHYISPEQARAAKEIDFRTDIYSLGCTLYHMLTGQTPYQGDSSMAVMMKHVNETPPAIFKSWPACPTPVGMLVGKMLAKNPAGRHASYDELITELMTLHDKLARPGMMAPVAATPAPTPPARVTVATPAGRTDTGNRKALFAAAGMGVAAALVGTMWWMSHKTIGSAEPAPLPQSTASTSSETAAWKNLIPLVDPQLHASGGDWKVVNGELICDNPQGWCFCEIPVNYNGGNYDLRIRVTRGDGSRVGMFFPFRKGSTGGDVIFDYYTPQHHDGLKRAGLGHQPGRLLEEPAGFPLLRPQWISVGQEATVLLQVRDEALIVQLDGNEVFRWPAEWSQLQQGNGFERAIFRKTDGRPVFGVGIFNCRATYHAIEMREVTGGKAPSTAGR